MTWNVPTDLDNIPEENQQLQQQRQQVQQRRGYANDFAFLHQLLFQHVVHQKNEGVPIQEIENFLHDRRAVKSFFESRGCKFRTRAKSQYFRIVNRRLVMDTDSTSSDGSSSDDDEFPWEPPGIGFLNAAPPPPMDNDAVEREESERENPVNVNENDQIENENETISENPIQSEQSGQDDDSKKSNGWSMTTGLLWLKRKIGINSRRLMKISKYMTIFAVITLIGHFGICHLLDVNPFQFFPSLMERRCLIPAHPIIMEMTRPIADCGFCKEGQGTSKKGDGVIEMKGIPNRTEFSEVAYLSKPVIIRGGGRHGGMPVKFDFQMLKEIFQSEPGGVDAVSEECQFLPFRSPFATLREAFDKIGKNSDWDEPWYIGWSNCHPGVAAKLRKLFPRPNFLPEDSSSSAIDWIFIGSPGLGASMHIDYVKRPSWQAQLSGVKRWLLHPPPECESVCPESVTFTIYPGDLVFLETNTWYHQTFIEGNEFSISIGSEYD